MIPVPGAEITGRVIAWFVAGWMVEEPATTTGAVMLSSAGNAVPVKVAVTVVDCITSVSVITLPGEAEDDGTVVCLD